MNQFFKGCATSIFPTLSSMWNCGRRPSKRRPRNRLRGRPTPPFSLLFFSAETQSNDEHITKRRKVDETIKASPKSHGKACAAQHSGCIKRLTRERARYEIQHERRSLQQAPILRDFNKEASAQKPGA